MTVTHPFKTTSPQRRVNASPWDIGVSVIIPIGTPLGSLASITALESGPRSGRKVE